MLSKAAVDCSAPSRPQALLASSTRAQLTTVVAGSPAAEEPKVASAVVQFLAPRGCDPLILLHPEVSLCSW